MLSIRHLFVQHSCTLKSREDVKAVPSKLLLALPTLVPIRDINVRECHEDIRPGNQFASCSSDILHCHTALSESAAFQVEQAAQAHRRKPGPRPKNSESENFHNAAHHRPSVRTLPELWLAKHRVPAHRDTMKFGSATLELPQNIFTEIDGIDLDL